jgi:hypothetical protein
MAALPSNVMNCRRLTSSIGLPLRNPPGTIYVSLPHAQPAAKESQSDLTNRAHYRQPYWRARQEALAVRGSLAFSCRISLAYRVLDTT